MDTSNFTSRLFAILLIASTSHLALSEPNYPEDFTPQIIYQDQDYIAEHSQSEQSQMTASTTTECCSCTCSSQSDSKYPADFEPVILYQDQEYISNH